jgi:hypothetical protein
MRLTDILRMSPSEFRSLSMSATFRSTSCLSWTTHGPTACRPLGSTYHDMVTAGEREEPTPATVRRLATKPGPEVPPASRWLTRRIYGDHVVSKIGHPLSEIAEIPERFLSTLREELSVTTVEEFLDLASRYPSDLQQLLDADDTEWSQLIDVSRAALSRTELDDVLHPPADDYPYMTGHDAPADGRIERKPEGNDDDQSETGTNSDS